MKFNGVDPRTLHPRISIAKEIPPGTVTSQLETLSGSTGEIVVGRTIQQGEYIVRMNIAGKTWSEAWEIRQLIAGWARGTDAQTCELIPTHWPAVHYDALLKEITPPEFVKGKAVIDVIFAVPRPIAVSNTERTTANNTSGLIKPVIGGTSHARPVITGYCKGSTGFDVSVGTKKYVGLTGDFAEGEYVEISTNPPQVRIRSVDEVWAIANDRVDYTVTDFQGMAEAFAPGERTIMCPQASQVRVSWRDEWL